MALPSSGLIKLSDIRAEYGGPNPLRLKDYYLNGAHVHQNPNGTIPGSGIITLKNFYGGIGGYPAPAIAELFQGATTFTIVRDPANVVECLLEFTKNSLRANGGLVGTWADKPYARLTILASTNWYPSTGFWGADYDCLLFTGGPISTHQPNPARPFTSGWINTGAGGTLYVNAQTGADGGGMTLEGKVDIMVEYATAPDPAQITHAQNFSIEIYR